MNEDFNIEDMRDILDKAYKYSPPFLRGLLIPDEYVSHFIWLISHFMDMTKEAVKLRKDLWESAQASQKGVNDFMVSLCNRIKDGSIKFGNKEVVE